MSLAQFGRQTQFRYGRTFLESGIPLSLSNEPRVYAEGILSVLSFTSNHRCRVSRARRAPICTNESNPS